MHTMLASRSDFSIGESILKPSDVVEAAAEVGMKAVALTDTMTVTGLTDLSTAADEKGIKAIIGVRLRISENATWRPNKDMKETRKHMPKEFFVTLYARTENGLKAIYRLLTLANDDAHFYYRAKLDHEDLFKELVNLSGDDYALVLGDEQGIYQHKKFDDIMAEVLKLPKKSVYLPIVMVNTPYYGRINQLSIGFGETHDLPLLAIRPVYYEKDNADVQEVMSAVCEGVKVTDGFFRSRFNRDLCPMTLKEFVEEAKKCGEHLVKRGVSDAGTKILTAIQNTDSFVASFNYKWAKKEPSLPKLATDEFAALVDECKKGFVERFKKPMFGHTPSKADQMNVYLPRLQYELSVLQKLGFSPYFLNVQNIVRFAKSSGIMVGPGRGSCGGSLVAYLMGITDIDPIRFGLMFERFINPERLDLPDADLDFMSERRLEIVDYLENKFGKDKVAGVSNFGTLGAASSMRDVGKALCIPEREYSVSKFVPKVHGQPVSLAEAAEQVSEIKEFSDNNPVAWEIMLRCEDLIRNMGQHAAGIVVAGEPLTEFGFVEQRAKARVVNWDKRVIESQGLVKIDLLGLTTLDVIALALKYIKEYSGKDLALNEIPLDDPKVLKAFGEGRTTGVFQYEGGAARGMLRKMASSAASVGGSLTFEDVAAVSALNRPGPLEAGLDDLYIEGRSGNASIKYSSPYVQEVLKPTFGAIVYQEQIQQISKDLSGFTGAESDHMRKAISKKDPEKMAKMEKSFKEGAMLGYANVELEDGRVIKVHRASKLLNKTSLEYDGKKANCVTPLNDGMSEMDVDALWADILGFAAYSFNKSHTFAYALISYQCMYLKVNYPLEFYAATMTMLGEEKLLGLMRDAKSQGITISFPDINKSSDRFEIIRSSKEIVIPFQRVKGISEKSAAAILSARESGPFVSVSDFCSRVEKRTCNARVRDALEKVGAYAGVDPQQPSANDPCRIRDQVELLPGLVSDYVPVDREMHHDKTTKDAIVALADEYRAKFGPGVGTSDGLPCKPRFGRSANKIMVITDAPNGEEESSGVMGVARVYEAVNDAMLNADLMMSDVYWTSLIKRPKVGKQVSPEEISDYKPYLMREIDILKPTVIVLLGSQSVRQFIPGFKGKASDQAGEVIYSKDMDANIVIGFSAGEIFHDPAKQELMDKVWMVVKELI